MATHENIKSGADVVQIDVRPGQQVNLVGAQLAADELCGSCRSCDWWHPERYWREKQKAQIAECHGWGPMGLGTKAWPTTRANDRCPNHKPKAKAQ